MRLCNFLELQHYTILLEIEKMEPLKIDFYREKSMKQD